MVNSAAKARTIRGPVRLERYVGQAGCALSLIAELLDRLEALGRLDQATILIHGDTGAGVGLLAEAGSADPTDKVLGWPKDALLSFVTPVLLIKRPAAAGPPRVVGQPTQLVDLVPSLLDILDLPPPDYPLHGRSVHQARGALRPAPLRRLPGGADRDAHWPLTILARRPTLCCGAEIDR